MLKEGDKVTMLTNDGWAAVGWIGTITDIDTIRTRVQWDNGQLLYHDHKNLKAINLLYIGARVMMKISDPWARKGWTGTVINMDSEGGMVRWDVDRSSWHLNRKLLFIGSQVDDPNMAFILYKKGVS